MPLIAAAAIGAGGSILGGILGSSATKAAAKTQADAATRAAELAKQSADDSLAFNKDVFNTQQQNQAPWLRAGQQAVFNLSNMLNPGGSLAEGWDRQFQAPTDVTEQNDPGYQFRMQQGQQALERSAAAKGGVLSGGTLKAISRYGQDYASNEYQNVYNRAKDEYSTAYNQFQQNQANQFNRFSSLAGLGQVSAGQLSTAGTAAAGQNANILQNSSLNIGNAQQNAAAANASGYVGSANAWASAFGGAANNISSALTLRSLQGPAAPSYATVQNILNQPAPYMPMQLPAL